MSDDEYERQPRKPQPGISPPAPDEDGSDGEDYERRRKPRLADSNLAGQRPPDEAAPLKQPGLSLPLANKMPGDDRGSGQKDVLRNSEIDHQTPVPTLPADSGDKPASLALLPDSVKTRQTVVNILCYLNVLFVLVYFGITV